MSLARSAAGSDFVTVVSGLPRSGTSMVMKMLEAGGMPLLSDHLRAPDEDNPRGYYELERVKGLKDDKAWMYEAMGKAVKIISLLLLEIPPDFNYRVLFIRRNLREVLASQQQMLARRGEPHDPANDARMTMVFEKHLKHTEEWLRVQDNIQVLFLEHADLIATPDVSAARIKEFLALDLDVDRMAAVVDPSLHRQKGEGHAPA